MSFHDSAVSYELQDGHILRAVLVDGDGNEKVSILDLNTVIENNNGLSMVTTVFLDWWWLTLELGEFGWKESKFTDSAHDVEISTEGDDNVPVLRARLENVDGDQIDANINLAERITNDNGSLRFT